METKTWFVVSKETKGYCGANQLPRPSPALPAESTYSILNHERKIRAVSSALHPNLALINGNGAKSFRYDKNIVGPNTLSCGIPKSVSIRKHIEESTLTSYFLPVK